MPKRILFICHRIPYPPNKGEKIRSYNILRYLSERYEVTLAFLIDDKRDVDCVNSLRPLVKNLYFEIINPKIKKLRSSLVLMGKRPISVPYFYSPKLQKKIDTFLDHQDIDCAFCSSSPTAEYLFQSRHYSGKLRSSKWVMDFIDMDSYKWHQYAERSRWPMRWIYNHEAKHLLAYEDRISREFQELLLVSELEKALFVKQIPNEKTRALSNGVDMDFFDPTHKSPIKKDSPTLVFTGAMDYWPNIDGIVWFAEKVFPLIRKKISNLTLYIVGSNPAAEVQRLAKNKGIIVTGFVDDVRDYLVMASICVIPLRIARGIQNKVLEAMAMGKATVCSPQALEGIGATAGEHVMVAEEGASFAAQITNLIIDKKTAENLGKQARKFIENNYTWNVQLSALETILNN